MSPLYVGPGGGPQAPQHRPGAGRNARLRLDFPACPEPSLQWACLLPSLKVDWFKPNIKKLLPKHWAGGTPMLVSGDQTSAITFSWLVISVMETAGGNSWI